MMKKRTDLITFFTGVVLGSIQSLVGSAFDGLERATNLFAKNLARRIFLYFFVFMGGIFILIGLARFLSIEYGFPGSGEIIIGVSILVLSFVIYVLTKNDS